MRTLIHSLLFVLYAATVCAQYEVQNHDADAIVEQLFQPLDMNDVPTGYFFPKAGGFWGLGRFQGDAQTGITENDLFLNLYERIEVMDVSDNNYELPPVGPLETAVDNYSGQGPLPLMLLFHTYNDVKDEALNDNILDFTNEQFVPGPNYSAGAYRERRVVTMSPYYNQTGESTIELVLYPGDVYGNRIGEIVQYAYLGPSGSEIITPGVPFSVDLTAPGANTLEFQITDNNGNTFLARTNIDLQPSIQANTYNAVPDASFTLQASTNLIETDLVDGTTVDMFFACDRLYRPLIVVEGFNDGEIISNVNSASFFEKFPFNEITIGSSDYSLDDLMAIEGYDIVYIDFQNATRDMRHNARVLREVIYRVNAMKAENGSDEPNVVMGLSMGGLISKYALRKAATDGEDDVWNVSKFISWDSPLRGNNFPLSFQYALDFIANYRMLGVRKVKRFKFNLEIAGEKKRDRWLEKAEDLLNSPAATQLTFYHYNALESHGGGYPFSYNINPSQVPNYDDFPVNFFHQHNAHLAFFDEMNGFSDMTCEQISMSNGAETGQQQRIAPSAKMIELNLGPADISYSILTEAIDDGLGIFAGLISIPVSLGLAGGSKVKLKLFAMPNFSTTTEKAVFDGHIRIILLPGLLAVTPWWGAFILVTANPQWRNIKLRNVHPLDSAPGGTFGFSPPNLNIVSDEGAEFNIGSFCFTPTASALDLPVGTNLNADFTTFYSDPSGAGSNADALIASNQLEDRWLEDSGNPTNRNTFHVSLIPNIAFRLIGSLLTPKSIEANLSGDLYEIYNSGSNSTFGLSDNTYVFSTSLDALEKSLTVNNGAALHINRSGPIGLFSENNPLNTTGEDFDFDIRPDRCEPGPITLTIASGADFLIGEWGNNVGNKATVTIHEDATVDVYGRLIVDHESDIVVKSGAKLLIRKDARLQLGVNSNIIVEPGGTIAFEDESEVRLYSGNQPDGTARIDVYGTLEINGTPDFDGNGSYHLREGSLLTSYNGMAVLHGDPSNPEWTFLRIDGAVAEEINLTLRDGAVEGEDLVLSHCTTLIERIDWSNGTGLPAVAAQDGLLTVHESDFHNLTHALDVSDPVVLEVTNTIFEDLSGTAIYSEDIYSSHTTTWRILNCDFNRCRIGIDVQFSDMDLLANKCSFTASPTQGFHALRAVDLVRFDLRSSTVRGYQQGIVECGTDCGAAIELYGVPRFFLKNGTVIEQNAVGVKALNLGQEGEVLKTNVFVRESTIRDNGFGVHIKSGGIDEHGLDYGLVSMACSELLENTYGIAGTDVLLEVDAYQLGGHETPRTNHF